MNYGKKFKYIMIAAAGMFIAITGIAFKTDTSRGIQISVHISILLLSSELSFTIYGLIQLSKYK